MKEERHERISRLQSVIENGQDAEAVKRYADKWLEEIEKETLNSLRAAEADLVDVHAYYRACVYFHQQVLSAVRRGQEKQQTLAKIVQEG